MEGLREEGDQLLSEASVIKRLDKNAVGAMAKKKEVTLKVICRRAPRGQGGVTELQNKKVVRLILHRILNETAPLCFSVLLHFFDALCSDSCLSQGYRNRCYACHRNELQVFARSQNC